MYVLLPPMFGPVISITFLRSSPVPPISYEFGMYWMVD